MQSKIISLFFPKQQLKMALALQQPIRLVQQSSFFILHLNTNHMTKLGWKKIDGKALGNYNCQDMSFLIFWSAFASGNNLLSAAAFPSINHAESESSSIFRSSMIWFWSHFETRLDKHSQSIIIPGRNYLNLV